MLFIAQLGGAIYMFVNRSAVTKAVGKSIDKYGTNTTAGKEITEGWDTLQQLVRVSS